MTRSSVMIPHEASRKPGRYLLAARMVFYYVALLAFLGFLIRALVIAAGLAGKRKFFIGAWLPISVELFLTAIMLAEGLFLYRRDRSLARSSLLRLFRFSVTHETDLLVWVTAVAYLSLPFVGAQQPLYDLGRLPFGTPMYFLFWSFTNFAWHVACHRVPALWEFHKMHHSATELTALTANRGHFLVIVPHLMLARVFFGMQNIGVCTVVVVLLALSFLQHSQLCFRMGWLGRFVISPYAHHIHHLRDPGYQNHNFGFDITLWDRLLGTFLYEIPLSAREMDRNLGLPAEEEGANGKRYYVLELGLSVLRSFGLCRVFHEPGAVVGMKAHRRK